MTKYAIENGLKIPVVHENYQAPLELCRIEVIAIKFSCFAD